MMAAIDRRKATRINGGIELSAILFRPNDEPQVITRANSISQSVRGCFLDMNIKDFQVIMALADVYCAVQQKSY